MGCDHPRGSDSVEVRGLLERRVEVRPMRYVLAVLLEPVMAWIVAPL